MTKGKIRRQGVAKADTTFAEALAWLGTTLREELVGYDQGHVAEIVVGRKMFFNAEPHGRDDKDNPNQPYWQASGPKGVLFRFRGLPEGFKPANRNALVGNFKVTRVTTRNIDGTPKKVTIAVTGMATDEPVNCTVKGYDMVPDLPFDTTYQSFPIGNAGALVVRPLNAEAKKKAA